MLNRLWLRILDFFRPVFLDITEADIQAAISGEAFCPALAAARRQWKTDLNAVTVARRVVRIYTNFAASGFFDNTPSIVLDGGTALQNFTYNYDSGFCFGDSCHDNSNRQPVLPTRIRLTRMPLNSTLY